MKKWILLAAVLLGCIPVGAQQVAEVTVYPSRENGPVKMMNAANNFASAGPKAKELGVPVSLWKKLHSGSTSTGCPLP